MKQQAILDFSDDGKAVVQIPDVGEIAFINMFGFSPINEVECDIEQAEPESELTKGKLLFFNQYNDVARILEKDLPTYDDQVKEIMESCKMTREQTKYCLKLPTNEIAKFSVNETEREISSIEKRLSFLKRLL